MRVAELDMHPLDAAADSGLDRKTTAQDEHGLGYCNITKCCTEVCPEGIKITDNALIPLRSGPPTGRHDPVVWLGNKIRRRKRVGPSPAPLSCPRARLPRMRMVTLRYVVPVLVGVLGTESVCRAAPGTTRRTAAGGG